jgi:hypothetical protein
MKVTAIRDAHLLPGGNILTQQGWTRIVEVMPDKKAVWEYDAAKSNGNAGRSVEVDAFPPLGNGLTMLAESGPGRIIEVDRHAPQHGPSSNQQRRNLCLNAPK